ncbi:hypothetical protein, partial [Marinomonas lutimaris]|uniref:hypothetical protein n=1 Tax=Marinomonas lutimaris TaxID=2846746 RepID=UPI001CA500EF
MSPCGKGPAPAADHGRTSLIRPTNASISNAISSTRRSCATLWRFRVINRKTLSDSKAYLCLTVKIVL